MKLNIGNLESHVEINIELIYIQKIEADGEGFWRFMLPLTITPKYGVNSVTEGFDFINNNYNNLLEKSNTGEVSAIKYKLDIKV